jgi:hypothetical protein
MAEGQRMPLKALRPRRTKDALVRVGLALSLPPDVPLATLPLNPLRVLTEAVKDSENVGALSMAGCPQSARDRSSQADRHERPCGRAELFFLRLPPLIDQDDGLAEQLIVAHGIVANVLLAVIALHTQLKNERVVPYNTVVWLGTTSLCARS